MPPSDPLRPVDHRPHWGRALPGIEKTLRKTASSMQPDDVWDALESDEAFLLLSSDGGVIWYPKVCEYSGEKTFWVWMAWSGPGRNAIAEYQDQISEVAARAGFDRVAFESPRMGYQRLLDPSWQVATVQYERRCR